MNKRQVEVLAKFFSEGISKDDKDRANVEALSRKWSEVFDKEYYENGTSYYEAQVKANIAVLDLVKVRPLIDNPEQEIPKEIVITTSGKEFVIVEADGGIEITKMDLSEEPDHDIQTSGYIPHVVHIS